MGRGAKWEGRGERWAPQAPQGGRSWAIWPGAYSPKASQNPPWQKGGNSAPSQSQPRFPAYDAKPPSGYEDKPDPRDRLSLRDTEDADGTLVPSVQRALNGARKAEARVLKLQKDKDRTEKQWKDYVRDSRAAYVKEHNRHLRALEFFEKEMADALVQQKNARVLLKHAAFQEALPEAGATSMEISDAGADWERMVSEWEQEQAKRDDAVLRRAMMERSDVRSTFSPPQPRHAAPRSPLPTAPLVVSAPGAPLDGNAGRTDGYGPAYNAASPAARVDPYPAPSPGPAAREFPPTPSASVPGLEPSLGTSPVPPPARSHTEVQRKSMPATTTHPDRPGGPSTVADKLEAKRSAMMPFGRPPGLALATADGPGLSGLVDDDLDDDPAEDVVLRPVEESTVE